MNIYLPVYCTVRDCRCAAREYDLSRLPKASVILCFHTSERLERLLHTIHSIILNSAPEVLREILLIADNVTEGKTSYPFRSVDKGVKRGKAIIYLSQFFYLHLKMKEKAFGGGGVGFLSLAKMAW